MEQQSTASHAFLCNIIAKIEDAIGYLFFMYSIEYFFKECNLNKKVIHIELSSPVLIEDKLTTDIILLKVDSDPDKDMEFLQSIKVGNNTNNGTYRVIVSDKDGDPLNPQIINLNLQDIVSVWKK